MSVHDAQPSDVYVDANGKLWRVVGTWNEPTVCVQEVEPLSDERPARMTGGINGLMWEKFHRIYRPRERTE